MDSQNQAGARFAILGLDVQRERLLEEAVEARTKQLAVLAELADTVKPDTDLYWRLTHVGRCYCQNAEGGSCGSPGLSDHCHQARDQSSWVQGSMRRWLLMGVTIKLNLGNRTTRELYTAVDRGPVLRKVQRRMGKWCP